MAQPARQPVEDLNRVLEISRAMAATHQRDELLNLIIDRSLELLDCERATLFLYDRPAGQLVARIATGVEEIRVPADKGFCGQAIQTGQTIVVPDAYADPMFNPEVDKSTGFRTRNIMSIPLRDYEGGLVGVLQVLNKRAGAFDDYDVNLAETLAAQAGVIIQRANLIEHYLEKQRMERAMEIARDIQRGLLPDDAPSIPGFDVAGLSHPADETGGDTYDFIPLPNGHWAFTVADATGHGIGPALVIAETRAMLRASAHLAEPDSASVCHILQTVNKLLAEDLGGQSFVTCFLGILDPPARCLTYASAGHGPLVFYHRDEDRFEEVPATGLPLAIMPDTDYAETRSFQFDPEHLALITTDGVFEAMNSDGEQFGIERMKDVVRAHASASTADLVSALRQAVRDFAGEAQDDDITVIALGLDS